MQTTSFYYYLKDKGLAGRTIEENVKDLERFIRWTEENRLSGIEQITYNELLKYVQYLKSQSLSLHTVNVRLNSLRKYYDHLNEEGTIDKNPARHLHIKGETQRVTETPLSYNQLESLYQEYVTYSKHKSYRMRSQAMLGLLLWQGLHSGELAVLEVKHINLDEGTIYVPGTRRSNHREIKLEVKQIIQLHTYISNLPAGQERLFAGSIHNWVNSLMQELKGINPEIRNTKHIRASVILYWIKMYGKRKVQYMCGHRYISSTQHYEVQELDSLTDALLRHHPFG